jgi:hypothetical protein
MLMSVFFMIEGISKTVFSLTIRPFPNWGWVLASGILGILIAVWLLANPAMSLLLLGILIGVQLDRGRDRHRHDGLDGAEGDALTQGNRPLRARPDRAGYVRRPARVTAVEPPMVEHLPPAHLLATERGYQEEAVPQQVLLALLDDEHDAAWPVPDVGLVVQRVQLHARLDGPAPQRAFHVGRR